MPLQKEYDYVIVGAGSAGCVLAARLTEDPTVTVLLVEAGGMDRSLFIRMPIALSIPLQSEKYSWKYYTEPEPYMNNRHMYCPRGRVLGGSSSINGMVYVRGHALDFDTWAGNDMPEWSYAHCLPYFRKAETYERGGDEYRGDSGPLYVTAGKFHSPLYQAFVDAGVQAGYPATDDMNGFQQEGFGIMDRTTKNGRRWSTADAYLKPALNRSNLHLEVRARTHRVLFDGRRATGIEFEQRGEMRNVYAGRSVILSGGTINSPQLLLLSGVGPRQHLADLDIPVIADVAGVGENLQDHLDFSLQVACTQPVSYYPATKPLGKLGVGINWFLGRDGIGRTNLFEAGGFVRTRSDLDQPNLQYHFMAIAADYNGKSTQDTHAYQTMMSMMLPESRGRLWLKSADPTAPPAIRFNYLATEQDRRDAIDAVHVTRRVLSMPAFHPYRGEELAPGENVKTDDEILAWIRATAETEYHPTSTCTMGTGDDSVVDPELLVHGIENLRVVDASIMPTVVSGNTNAATIMIAEKAADIIAGRSPLPASYVPVYQSSQRATVLPALDTALKGH